MPQRTVADVLAEAGTCRFPLKVGDLKRAGREGAGAVAP